MEKQKIISALIAILFFTVLICLSLNKIRKESNCSIREEFKVVRGNSLEPLIPSGSRIKILFGYYNCHEVKKNDLVVYHYAGNEVPLLKIVKGIPGDKFELKPTQGGWYILINGEILKNSENQPYLLDEKRYKILSLYERDYGGIIPSNAYLILSNLPSGGLDSTSFGLVHRNDILGKAVKE
jgi:signal peptidase I